MIMRAGEGSLREAQLVVLHTGMLPQPLHGALGWTSLTAVHRGSPSLRGGGHIQELRSPETPNNAPL